jgi:hypothetical protein
MLAEVEFPTVAAGGHADQLTLHLGQGDMVYKRLDEEAAKTVRDAAAGFEKRMRDNIPLPGSEAAVRKLIADIQTGKPDESMFTPDGRDSLQQLQAQVSQMGTVQSISFLRVGPARTDIYRVESEKGSWTFRIVLSAEGKVEQANLLRMQQQ